MTRDVSVDSFSLALADPLQTSAGTIRERRGFLLAVDGAHGEATPLAGWTESLDDCEDALRAAADALRSGANWDDALEACEGAPAARHAVDVARADTDATRAGVPLAEYLTAGDAASEVPVNATVGDAPPRETAALAREAVTGGFDCVKLKVGNRPVPGDVERLRAVRATVGSDVELRADANGAWSRAQAREALDALDGLDVSVVEQPLAADDVEGLADLRSVTDVDVAVDETLVEHDVGDVLMAGAADALVLKPMVLGGVERAHAAALEARELDVTPIVTTTVDAVVARTAAVHVAASLGDVPACGLATASRLAADLAPDPAPVDRGRIAVPDDPGLGVASPEVPEDA